MKKSQKGAWPQKPVKQAKAARACFRRFFAAPTPSAALASQLGKLPQSEKVSQPPARVPQSETSASQPCKFPRARKLAITLANIPKRNPSPPRWQPFPRSASHKDPLLTCLVVWPGRRHIWNLSTASMGVIFCRQFITHHRRHTWT